jgi:hypothetical protein
LKRLLAGLLILSALAAKADDAPLGRLFFSAQERAALDRQRQQGTTASSTLDGEVRRSSGKNTRWVNGQAQYIDETPAAVAGKRAQPDTGLRQELPEGVLIVGSRRH